jgi:hypothetical protein
MVPPIHNNPVIRVCVTRTLDDLLFLNRHIIGNSRWMRQMRWIGALMTFPAIGWAFVPLDEGSPPGLRWMVMLGLLVLPTWFCVVVPLTQSFAVRKQWRTNPALHEPMTFVFSESAMETSAESFSATTSWRNIAKAERVGSRIVLSMGQNLFHIVPENAFETSKDYDAFCKLVDAKVPKCRL